jgi:hypothetical protein
MPKEYWIKKGSIEGYYLAEGGIRTSAVDGNFVKRFPYQNSSKREVFLDFDSLLRGIRDKIDPGRKSLLHLMGIEDSNILNIRNAFKGTKVIVRVDSDYKKGSR